MKNQHQHIKGYRDLSQEEIELMNEIKQKADECGKLVNALRFYQENNGTEPTPFQVDQRWVSIGQTHLQEGFMALVRSVAKPESF